MNLNSKGYEVYQNEIRKNQSMFAKMDRESASIRFTNSRGTSDGGRSRYLALLDSEVNDRLSLARKEFVEQGNTLDDILEDDFIMHGLIYNALAMCLDDNPPDANGTNQDFDNTQYKALLVDKKKKKSVSIKANNIPKNLQLQIGKFPQNLMETIGSWIPDILESDPDEVRTINRFAIKVLALVFSQTASKLDENATAVLLSIKAHTGETHLFVKRDIVCREMQQNGMSEDEFAKAVDDLLELGAIENNLDDRLTLNENVFEF